MYTPKLIEKKTKSTPHTTAFLGPARHAGLCTPPYAKQGWCLNIQAPSLYSRRSLEFLTHFQSCLSVDTLASDHRDDHLERLCGAHAVAGSVGDDEGFTGLDHIYFPLHTQFHFTFNHLQ